MAILSRDQILSARADRVREAVPVPEFGGEILVQGMTAGERNRYESAVITQKKGGTKFDLMAFRSTLLRYSLVDESGAFLFDDDSKKAIDAWPATVTERLIDVAKRLSGIGDQDEADLGLRSADSPAGSSASASRSV